MSKKTDSRSKISFTFKRTVLNGTAPPALKLRQMKTQQKQVVELLWHIDCTTAEVDAKRSTGALFFFFFFFFSLLHMTIR
jgi:lipopolysaccharide/colanic/teichoic acid biosynthesis glycosyltransferase